MKHTAIYVRVSSKAQDHASQLPDSNVGLPLTMDRFSGIGTSSPARRWTAPAWKS